MATDLGTAIDCVTDVGARFTFVSGKKALANAIARRLITPRGTLSWDADYGSDVRSFLNRGSTQQARFAIGAAVNDECLKEERVDSCSTDVEFVGATLLITIQIVAAQGPFTLVLSVDSLTVTILEAA